MTGKYKNWNAYERGFNAFCNGRTLGDDNPYHSGFQCDNWLAWRDGWLDAQEHWEEEEVT